MRLRVPKLARRAQGESNFRTEHCDDCNAILPRGRTFAFLPGTEAKDVRFLCVRCLREAKRG